MEVEVRGVRRIIIAEAQVINQKATGRAQWSVQTFLPVTAFSVTGRVGCNEERKLKIQQVTC